VTTNAQVSRIEIRASRNPMFINQPLSEALQAAVYYISEHSEFRNIVDKLLEGNADLSIAVPGPIVYICLQYNKVSFAKYLVSVGADVEQRTVFNQSCFYRGNIFFPFFVAFSTIIVEFCFSKLFSTRTLSLLSCLSWLDSICITRAGFHII
jgi:hypothetical protein